jgi:nitroimidazol reductase NimA-like FMN-containing flavoprotein (pyridoxamine 5'-phosphate oxidase superfamily)
MRRKDKEITDINIINEILSVAEIIRLAMVDGDEPYVVSMNYVYMDNALFMHSALEGRKIDILKRNSRVAFTVDTDVSIILGDQASACTTRYNSVFGTGRAVFVGKTEDKIKVLNAIMDKHGGNGEYHYPEAVLNMTGIIRVDIDFLSGKKSGF